MGESARGLQQIERVRQGWVGWLLVGVVWALITVTTVGAFSGVAAPWQTAIVAAAVAAQLLPALAVAQLPRPVPPARYWVAVWALVFFASDLMQLAISVLGRESNLWFYLIANPIEDAAILMAYSYWQLRPVMRTTFRIAIPLLAIATLAIAVSFGEVNTFKAASSPFRLLLIATAAAYTLVARTSVETEHIWTRDWLWTSLGVILYYAAYVVVDPVSKALLPEHQDLARQVYVVKAGVDVLAYLLVWKGMRCPVEASLESTSVPSWRLG